MSKARNWDETSFIDIAVQDGVRDAMLSGRAALIFDRESGALRWANGAAAALFGLAAIGSRAGEAALPISVETGFRQIRAVLASLKEAPRTALVRLPSGVSSRLVRCHVRRVPLVGVRGRHALVTAPARETEMSEAQCLTMALAGLENGEAGAAVVDGAGRVLQAGPRFGTMGLDEARIGTLAGQARTEGDRLVKQIVEGAGGDAALATGIGRLADLPERYLIVAVALARRPEPEPDGVDAGGRPIAPASPQPRTGEPEPTAASGQAGVPAFDGPDLGSGPIRFVWKTDHDGVFVDISPEFGRAVGPLSADVTGRAFSEVIAKMALDPAGDVAIALARRDTWSGKSVRWPIQGTDLHVPVDLAALPYYSRDRRFEGYRGFGVVRMADAETDPDARGLALVPPPSGAAAARTDGTGNEEVADRDGGAPAVPAQLHEPPALAVAPSHPMRRSADRAPPLRDARDRENAAMPAAPRHLSDQEAEAFRKIGQALGRRPGSEPADDADGSGTDGQAGTDAAQAAARAPDMADPGVNGDGAPAHAGEPDGDGGDADTAIGKHDDRQALAAPADAATEPREAPPSPRLGPDALDGLPLPLLIVRNQEAVYANAAFFAMTADADTGALNGRGLESLFDGAAPATDADPSDRPITLVSSDGFSFAARAHLQIVPWMGASALMFAFEPCPVEDGPEPLFDAAEAGEHAGTPTVTAAEIAELRAILDTATDGVILIDADSTIRSLSASAAALFGYANEEAEGKSFSFLFAHESQRAAMGYLHGLANNGVASVLNEGREVLGRERNGGFLPLFMTIGHMPATNGFCAVIRDITPWKQTEQALQDARRQAEQASNTKSEFLAKISHEIRTPLNAIIGFSELMAEERFGPIGNARYKDYLADINKSGRHVLDLVNDLLDISKIEAGKQELEFESVALNEAIGAAIAMVQPQANRNQIIVRSSLESTVPPVVADVRSIKQIVLNLLSNAIRFTHAGGQVIVSTSYTGDGAVLLRIRDSGIGMSEKELESALKPFQQVTAVGRQRGDGTGLGLPLTKALVEANRAEFAISSEPGQGTRIDILFPPARVLAS